MQLETTIYISEENYQKLEHKKAETGFSKSRLINCLFRKEVSLEKRNARVLETVSYQERGIEGQCFRRIHVTLEDELYERCLDMRKVFKLSVSYILALCIDQYLDNIDSEEFDTDNYTNIYLFFTEKDKFFKGYTIYWDVPTKNTIKSIKILRNLTRL